MPGKIKRPMALLLAALMIISVITSVPVLAEGPETISAWDCIATPVTADMPATSGTLSSGAILTNFRNITPTYGTSGLYISGWNNGADLDFWQISFSSKGYENLTIADKTRSSGTGPRDFKAVYSIDTGTNWSDVPGSAYSITSTTLKINMPTITLPADAANCDNVLVRFIMTSNISSRAGTSTYAVDETVASGGTSNINNIVVSGTPIAVIPPETVSAVTAQPEGGEVDVGSMAALSCVTDGATIMYSIDGGISYDLYDPASQISLDNLPIIIQAYATKSGMTDSASSSWKFTQKIVIPDTEPPVITHTPVATGDTGVDLEIKAQVTDDRNVSGVKLYYRTAGETDFKSLDMILANGEYSAVVPKVELNITGLQYYISASDGINTATEPADVSAPYLVTITAQDLTMPVITNLKPISGTYSGSDLRPEISAEYSDASGIDITSVKLLVDGADVTADTTVDALKVSYIPLVDMPAGKHTAYVEVSDIYGNKAITTWDFNVGEIVYNLYFGQLHSHTNNSDGIGSLVDAFGHAKNDAKLDFFAVTDHSNSLDNAAVSTIADGSKSTKWNNGRIAADSYTDSNFVGIYGYEMTWSDGTGHMNTFNTVGFETRDNAIFKAADGLLKYFVALKTAPLSISQFNHPGTTFGDFNDFANYDPVIDQRVSLVEVGNGEGQVRGSGYFPSYEYYTRALDKGWHLAPTNNQDNHLGNWGDSNTARTVLLADSLTRDEIYDAMENRRAYATEDNDLRINYTLNGNVMGTILTQKPDMVDIIIDLEDPDNEALGTVSVISDGGKVVASETLTTSKDEIEFLLPPDQSYYYVRVDEADKDIAVTAPVWIDEVDKAGIAKTSSGTSLPVKGRNLTITSSLYNNESVPMVIKSLEYSINGVPINQADSLSSIASMGAGSYSFDYIPAEAGTFNIDVKLTADFNGVEKIFSDVYKIKVTDPALVTTVIVDASHYNDYVSGYYANNMSNLVTLASNEGINIVIQKDKLTDDVLKDAQLLILSPPAKKSGTANGAAYSASPYTDDEIAAIKKFADNGGNIIITSLADYQDSRTDSTNHATYQQNLILAAVGAGSRFNDDEVVDYDNNPNVTPPGVAGGTPYRAPMKEYDMTSPYLSGVDVNQTYSFYSGCSFNMGANASWLVKGTPTTYGFDSDNDKLGGSYVSAANKTMPADTGIGKGNVNGLAVETLPGGGKLFIGGTVFYSNFEIKVQLDNSTQLQNSNYNIVMNILDSIKKVIPVTDINTIRNGIKGNAYCAEGTVTADTTPGNAFFDTIYIQDATGGINIYPVSGMDIKVGQKVRVTGTLDEYQGDLELRAITGCIVITDGSITPVNPKEFSTSDSMLAVNGGWLAKVQGVVAEINGNSIIIDDGTGAARIFVDGYIGDGTGNPDMLGKWDTNIKVGDIISAVGLASADAVGNRLRVRNTAEIVRLTVDVTGVELDIDSVTVNVGGTQQLTAMVSPETATNRELLWASSNESVAMVDNGLVTAIGAGSADITVSTLDGNFSAVCKVTAVVPVTGIKMIKESATLKLGGSEILTAFIFPEDATDKGLIWESGDPSVVSVVDGKINGLKIGSATITVKTKDGGFSDVCKVLVVKTPVSGVKIINEMDTLKVGKARKLIAKVYPSSATVKNAVWTSSDPKVATVKDGLVTGLKVGIVDITVTTLDGGFKDTCRIYVGANVTAVKIVPDKAQVDVGKSKKLSAVISPSNATNKNVAWTSSDEAIAIVSQDGVVTGLRQGKAVISATSEDGGITGKCTVTVGVAATGVKIIKDNLVLTLGKTERLSAYVFPRNATNADLVWTSSNTAVATVENGVVKAVGKGEAVITVTTKDGGFTDKCNVTVESPKRDENDNGHGNDNDHGKGHSH